MRTRVSTVVGLAALAGSALGQSQRTYIIDFEEYAEDTPITSQYARMGAFFSTHGGGTPIVAREGTPARSHNSSRGADGAFPSGVCGLTDPVVGGDIAVASDIVVDFDPPITSFQVFGVDIDGSEQATLRAYRHGVEVAALTRDAGSAGTGDGISTLYSVAAPAIDRVVFDVTAPAAGMGYGLDYMVFTRQCGVVRCRTPQVRVFQEEHAGAGDFVGLGTVGYFLTSATAAELYAYNVPDGDSYNGPLITPVIDRTHMLLADTADGLTLMVVHDDPVSNDNGAGEAEMRVHLTGDCSAMSRTVFDDPSSVDTHDLYTGSPGSCDYTSRQAYTTENTDGFCLSGMDRLGVLDVSFEEVNNPATAPVVGLTEWYVYSSTGSPIALDLELGRRVRFELVPPCPADFNGDGFVDFFDYDDYVTAFQAGTPRADFNQDGFLDFFDYDDFVDTFMTGC